jgi:hypothetical protein
MYFIPKYFPLCMHVAYLEEKRSLSPISDGGEDSERPLCVYDELCMYIDLCVHYPVCIMMVDMHLNLYVHWPICIMKWTLVYVYIDLCTCVSFRGRT